MTIRILRILSQLKEEIGPDLPDAVRGGFYSMGREKMEEYLRDYEIDADTLDYMVDKLDKYYTSYAPAGYHWTSMRWEDIEEALDFVVERMVDSNARWKDVAASPWFKTMQALVRENVGYIDSDNSGEYKNLPAGLKYLEKQRILANEAALTQAILNGLQHAEEDYLAGAVRSFLREFQEGYSEQNVPEPKEEEEQKVVEDLKDDKEVEEDVLELIQEPTEYSGRFAHAAL